MKRGSTKWSEGRSRAIFMVRGRGQPGEFGIDEWDGKQFRTFFMREQANGYCYCFYCPLEEAQTPK